jgi:hypothetical protein
MAFELRDEILDRGGVHVARFVWLEFVETSAVNPVFPQDRTWTELIQGFPDPPEADPDP